MLIRTLTDIVTIGNRRALHVLQTRLAHYFVEPYVFSCPSSVLFKTDEFVSSPSSGAQIWIRLVKMVVNKVYSIESIGSLIRFICSNISSGQRTYVEKKTDMYVRYELDIQYSGTF